MLEISWFKKYDFTFFILLIILSSIGILNLYSATHTAKSFLSGIYKTQSLYLLVSLSVGFIVSLIHPKHFYRYSYVIYCINMFLLLLVLLVGTKALGAQRWLVFGPFRLQPSETMKISLVLALGRWFSKNHPEEDIGFKRMLIPFLLALFPAILIIIQPNLGTGLLILLIFFTLTFYRRLKWKTIGILIFIGFLFGGLMFQYGLKDYQKRRITAFLNPREDTRGSSYNAIQSEIAIGSGQLYGKGLLKSSQASLNYLPENHSDFAFSVFNEEHGFFGSIFLIFLFFILLKRFIWVSSNAGHFYEALIVLGPMAIIFWHTFINMAMVTGLIPVAGIPLPFLSYGGSSLMTFCICCGLATSVSNYRKMFQTS